MPSPAPAPRTDIRIGRRARRVAPLLLAAALAGCRASVLALADGVGGAPPAVRVEHLFGALAARYQDVDRSARYQSSRVRMEKQALTPSRVIDDTSLWTGGDAGTRSLLVGGRNDGSRYRLWTASAVPRPTRPGDARHLITLTRIDDDEFRWFTSVDFSLGLAGTPAVSALLGQLLTAAGGRSERELRADYRGTFPRATAVLGQLASLDTLHPVPLADGSTALTLVVQLHPERIAGRYPALAKYLERYVETGRMRWTLRDAGGATWMTASARDNRIRVQLRTQLGELLPFGGAPRPMPDSLLLEGEAFVKVKIFTVGVSALSMDFVRSRGAGERAWTLVARREPEWHLPLASAHLLRAPLARPFMGRGAYFQIGLRESDGQTLLYRRGELAVQESAILRFLGSIGAAVVGDYSGQVEVDQDRFLRELFVALLGDARALTPGG